MPQNDDTDRPSEKEGVRIIGAEEAAEALERDDVVRRRGRDEPKFGDRPETPTVDEPRTTIRFPLGADEEPESSATARPAPAPGGGRSDTSLPHWTDPPTGELPRIFAAEDLEEDSSTWSSFTSGQPRWRGEGPERHDNLDDFSRLADDETRIGALARDDRPDPEDWFALDEDDRWDEPQPSRVGAGADEWPDEPGSGQTRPISSSPRRPVGARAAYDRPAGAGRDVPLAIGVGVGFAVVALAAFAAGPRFTVALVVAVLAVAAAELFNVLRQAGYQPAILLGLAACVAMPLAAYWRGEAALPVVMFLSVAFGMVWYLVGAGGTDRPVIGLSSTLLAVGYVGLLGSFASLMVALPDIPGGTADPGIGVLLGAVIATVGYDVGGFVVGRNAGSRPLSAASPNKTLEGLAGGMLGAILVSVVVTGPIIGIEPFGGEFADALALGIIVAIAAPLGDLCESLLKRDLDVKDMGSILPGHGGFLDRFDALLFVLPAVYYLARIIFY